MADIVGAVQDASIMEYINMRDLEEKFINESIKNYTESNGDNDNHIINIKR